MTHRGGPEWKSKRSQSLWVPKGYKKHVQDLVHGHPPKKNSGPETRNWEMLSLIFHATTSPDWASWAVSLKEWVSETWEKLSVSWITFDKNKNHLPLLDDLALSFVLQLAFLHYPVSSTATSNCCCLHFFVSIDDNTGRFLSSGCCWSLTSSRQMVFGYLPQMRVGHSRD